MLLKRGFVANQSTTIRVGLEPVLTLSTLTNGQLHAVFAQVSPHCDTRRRLPIERLAAFEYAFASADYGEVGETTFAAAADNVASVFGGQNDECNVGIDAWVNLWRGYLSLMKSSTTPVGGLSRFVCTCGTILFDMLVTVTTAVSDHAVSDVKARTAD